MSHLLTPDNYTHSPIPKIFTAVAQPVFQVLGPMYSEKWFDLNGRTTATMLIAIGPYVSFPISPISFTLCTANPIGGAIGQLLAPLVGTPGQSVSYPHRITSPYPSFHLPVILIPSPST